MATLQAAFRPVGRTAAARGWPTARRLPVVPVAQALAAASADRPAYRPTFWDIMPSRLDPSSSATAAGSCAGCFAGVPPVSFFGFG
jgi:hypothetical protein